MTGGRCGSSYAPGMVLPKADALSTVPDPPGDASTRGLPGFFARYQGLIDAALRRELEREELPLYDALRYMMGWVESDGRPAVSGGGKAVRPTLCLLASEAAGGEVDRAMPAAVALEYVHNFSLIHDDLEDRDRFRRHRLTVWAVWGEATALISGNLMLKVADRAIQGLMDLGVSAGVSVEAGKALTANYLRMMEGQFLDVSYETRLSVSVEEYLDMIERKTGALIETSVYLGALVGRAGEPERGVVSGLQRVGYELGRVFQIRDDMLGVWGGPATGKPVGADIIRKKKALPAVHAISHASGSGKAELERIYASDTAASACDVERVLSIMSSLNTQDYCHRLAAERWQNARAVLKSLELSGDSARDFEELGDYLLVRES